MRTVVFAILCLLLAAPAALAQWIADGVPVCDVPGEQLRHVSCSDGAGGWYLAWTDHRPDPVNAEPQVYLQHLTSSGLVAPGWPQDGLRVSSGIAPQHSPALCPDGAGGVFVAWEAHIDPAYPAFFSDIALQRYTPTGVLAPGWSPPPPSNNYTLTARAPVMVPDGAGGVLIGFIGTTGADWRVFARRVGSGGVVAWPSDATVAASDYQQRDVRMVPDGSGGACLVWQDGRDTGYFDPAQIYAMRIGGDGLPAPGWPATNAVVALGPGVQSHHDITLAGGALWVALQDDGGGEPDVYAQRLALADGARLTSGLGLPIATGNVSQLLPAIAPLPDGGVLIAWQDHRNGDFDLFAQRLQPSGSLAAGWPVNGRPLVVAAGHQLSPALALDGVGGLFVAWQDRRGLDPDIYALRTDAGGVPRPGWAPTGAPLCRAPGPQTAPVLAAGGAGLALASWPDQRGADTDLFAQLVVIDGPVPVTLTLVSAEATADRVRLAWHAGGATLGPVRLERREALGDWVTLATLSADGMGHIAYEDADVRPGSHYGYRLVLGSGETAGEVWVDVPSAEFALGVARPNPSPRLVAAVSLPDEGPARLEAFDVRGRRVAAREVGHLGAGRHVVALDEEGPLAPGVYLVRLVRADQVRVARAVVTR